MAEYETEDEGKRIETKVWFPRALDRAIQEEKLERFSSGAAVRGAPFRGASKSAVIRDAVRVFLAGRLSNKHSLGTQLRDARKAAGLGLRGAAMETQGELTPAGLSLIERDKHRPGVASLEALARAL